MDIKIIYFFIELALSIVLPSIATFSILISSDKTKGLRLLESTIISFGVGPALNVWLLNILLLLFSGLPHSFYIIFPTLFYFVVVFVRLDQLKKCLGVVRNTLGNNLHNGYNKRFFFTIVGSLLIFSLCQLYAITNTKINSADQIVYATQGKIFARNVAIQYKTYYFDEVTKFLYIALHGFSYPLFSSVNYLYNYGFGFQGDLYFKNISNYYLILLILLMLTQLLIHLPRKYKRYAFFGPMLFILSPVVPLLAYTGSVDTYRIFLLLVSYICIFSYLHSKSTHALVIVGISLGLTANSHAINLLFAVIMALSTMVTDSPFFTKLKRLMLLSFLLFVFGMYHYPLQVLIGDGWAVRWHSMRFPNTTFATFITKPTATYSKDNQPVGTNTNTKITAKAYIKKTNAERREIESPAKLIKNGILGIFFRFHYFGMFNWLLPALMLVYYKLVKPTKNDVIMLINLIALFLIISFGGYANFRYQYTLLPFFVLLTTLYLFKLFNLQSIHTHTVKVVVVVILSLSTVNAVYTAKNSLAAYVRKYSHKPEAIKNDTVKTQETNDTVKTQETADIIKSKAPSDYITFIQDLVVNREQAVLASGTRLLNYYTEIPVYFMDSYNYIYTADGKVPICFGNDVHANYKVLTDEYNIKYLAIRLTDGVIYDCVKDIIKSYGRKVYNSPVYEIYSI